jgi:hypothetical protein
MVYSDRSPEERERIKRIADFQRRRHDNSTLKTPEKPLREIFTDPQSTFNEMLLEMKAQSEILEKILLCLKHQEE